MNYSIYTDGACSGNPGPGGWGYAVVDEQGELIQEMSGNSSDTTNNQMELTAFYEALFWLQWGGYKGNFTIYTDSAYIYNCFKDKWYVKWELNGWRNSSRQPVANSGLWRAILALYKEYKNNITICKVAGHSGDKWNDYVDNLAVRARLML